MNMPIFIYKGKNRKTGKSINGELESLDKISALRILREQGIIPITINVKSSKFKFSFSLDFLKKSSVPTKDIVIFTRQFATMINAGLPLVQCLEILGSQSENKNFGKIIDQVKISVESGSTLAAALSKHPSVFNNLFVHMTEAGEAGGVLDVILNRLSAYVEKSENLKAKVKGAMMYPTVVGTFAIGISVFIILTIVPVFKKMFEDMGAKLPMPTQVLLGFSNFLIKFLPFIVVAIIILIILFVSYKRTPKGGIEVDKYQLKLPIFGILLKKVAVAKFARTLSTLINSGVSILDALIITAKTSGNKFIEKHVLEARLQIQEGKTLVDPLRQSKVFPHMVVSMIGVGEQAGALDAMLSKIADFYDQEVDTAVDSLTSTIEPFLMIFLGIVVGAIVIALFLPLLTVSSQIQG
ncbi:MAG: type II secretion system F family protein [bacterium]